MTAGLSSTINNLISLAQQLPGLQPPASPLTHVVGPSFTTLGPALLSAIGDLQTDAAGNAAAATLLNDLTTAVPKIQDSISATPSATALSGIPLWTLFVGATVAGLNVATIVAAQNLVNSLNANGCVPTVQALSDFQQAYHANNVGVVVSGVYDAATAAAVGTTLGVSPPACAVPVNPSSAPPSSLVALAQAVVADKTICNGAANANVTAFMTAYDFWAYPGTVILPPTIYDVETQTAINSVLGSNTAPACSSGGVAPAPAPVATATTSNAGTYAVAAVAVGGLGFLAYKLLMKKRV